MSTDFELNVEPREALGTASSRRLRREGKVPVVMYGAGKENANFVTDHDELAHKLAVEAFTSALINVTSPAGSEQAILRDVQMHPYRPRILHLDFQRVSATEKIHISIPIHFEGEEEAPGVQIDAGIVSKLITEVDVSCLPKDLPEYLELDVSAVEMNGSLHLSDIKVPEGVELTALAHEGEDLAVFAILPPKVEVEEVEEAEDEDLEGLEGDEEAGEGEGESDASSDEE